MNLGNYRWLVVLGSILVAGCKVSETRTCARSAYVRSQGEARTLSRETSGTKPLMRLRPLSVKGHGNALVARPEEGHPIEGLAVALHSHHRGARLDCPGWFRALGQRSIVLCPHGLPSDAPEGAPVTLGTAAQTLVEVEAGLEALQQEEGDIDRTSGIGLVGYSLGAERAVEIALTHPGRFVWLVLGEGAYRRLSLQSLQNLHRAGVQKTLLVCSSEACEMTFELTERWCAKTSLKCQLVRSGEQPHRFEGAVVDATARAWDAFQAL